MNNVIDRKTDSNSFGVWPFKEDVDVTLTLVETGPDQFSIFYDAHYSGIKDGSTHGGPISVSGNGNWVVNASPEVVVTVSGWSDDKAVKHITCHIVITVAIPVIGTKTIFDEVMGGVYGGNKMDAVVAHIAEISKPR